MIVKPRIVLWSLLILTLVAVTGSFLWSLTRSSKDSKLPRYGTVQKFSLTDQFNNSVTADSLTGTIWIADFIYTECGDQCPRLSRKMATIQSLLPKESNIQLVSISVDPVHDTPQVLSQYAKRFHADPMHWRFLTGSPAVVHKLAENLKLATPNQDPATFIANHSTRLMMVDRQLHIRGYYDGTNEEDLQRLLHDVSALANDERI